MVTPNFAVRAAGLVALAGLALLLVPAPASAGDAAAGQMSFVMFCAACHGEGGRGDGPAALALQPPPRDFTAAEFTFDTDGDGAVGTDADLKNVILQGAAVFGGSPLMAPWVTLTDADIANLIAFIRLFKE
jgi:mono/diheme cytochrome c family protein